MMSVIGYIVVNRNAEREVWGGVQQRERKDSDHLPLVTEIGRREGGRRETEEQRTERTVEKTIWIGGSIALP